MIPRIISGINRRNRYPAMHELQRLSSVVQTNCNISDARHARDYTICTYLLKMREYYRWEKGFAFGTHLPKDALGHWLDERERLWGDLEAEPFHCLPLSDECYDPFNAEAVNQRLVPEGLVYSSGYGRFAKPHFFLGRLTKTLQCRDCTVFVSSDEYARDLAAPPAMRQGKAIFIRRESFRRMLWEKYEEWCWKKQDNAMARAIAHYGFDHDVDRALDRMTDNEIEAAILHELGEGMAGDLLDPAWREMLADLVRTRAELFVRAVRDHLADCLSTLPGLLRAENQPSIHFYFANLTGLRRELFPSLNAAYQAWIASGSLDSIELLAAQGKDHWAGVARRTLDLHAEQGAQAALEIEGLINESTL